MAARENILTADFAWRFVVVVSLFPVTRLAAQIGQSAGRADPAISSETARTTEKLKREIREELATPGDHAWAGEYKLFMPPCGASLTLAPKTGFVMEQGACMGTTRDYGSVAEVENRLRLSSTRPDRLGEITAEFIPVPWGESMFLLRPDEMISFCNDVNAGDDLALYWFYLQRTGSGELRFPGIPQVPTEFQSYLFPIPLEAEIVAIGESASRPVAGQWVSMETTVTLNLGQPAGLLRGMELHVINPDGVTGSVTVNKVEPDRSEAVMFHSAATDRPRIGWRLSTRRPAVE